ncbi:hypothetical protein FJT64_024502 [Amphibalanus amphitrite]|uniref:Uncharacterized protein n=1 Tax=Amphibalanus amphitrite TaxID=1232801 RepID=A0A6A4WLK2_AMPAM|nr:hypothetical protein FJT64_024502 [Amphibalanus amphitrite]
MSLLRQLWPLFARADGRYCTAGWLSGVLRDAGLVQEGKVTTHSLRIGFATAVAAAGVSENVIRESEEVKRAELEIAAAMCCHCSVSSVDHISDLMKKHGKGSTLGKINLHRTKCGKLITEVISPSFRKELIDDVKGEKYSLIVDESTDVATNKNLAIVIRYFSKKEKRIMTDFVGLVPLQLANKDRTEKAAIKEVIPDCDQFLCSFHVLQSFRRELNLASVEKGERERILRVLQQLVFANSETDVINSQQAGSSGRRHPSRSTPSPLKGQTPTAPSKRQLQQQTSTISQVLEVIKSRRIVWDKFDSLGDVGARAGLDQFRALQPTAKHRPTDVPAAIKNYLRNPTEECHVATGFTESEEVKRAELEIAAAMCCHCSVSSVDHISDLMKKHGKGSTLGKINLHRTKCGKLITEVISPSFRKELIDDVKGEKYSLIVDESTDVATNKNLAIVIRYFSKKEKRIMTDFVGLVPMQLTDKARAEKAAIKEVIPDCDQFLCSFHVLQSFRRELNLASVEKGERERILRVLQQLVFANSETEYRRILRRRRHRRLVWDSTATALALDLTFVNSFCNYPDKELSKATVPVFGRHL